MTTIMKNLWEILFVAKKVLGWIGIAIDTDI